MKRRIAQLKKDYPNTNIDDIDEHCGACEDDMGGEEEMGSEVDDNGGLPLMGGALNVPHHGQPIRLGKIIQVGGIASGPASGELSGMTKAGVVKDRGGVPVRQDGDKETITAGGKKTDSSIASKSVGGPVTPGEGQRQGGLNTKGTIASTPRLDESKTQVRKIVKEVLKEIRFDQNQGKWVKINEGKHKPGCKCGFCVNKGKFGKKSEKEEMDEAEVNMKMGPSYKVVQPTLAKTSEPDFFARTNQYEPEISEMYDDEEEQTMNERYVSLANEQRNLSESELAELKSLREKIDMIAEKKKRTNKFLKKAINPKHKGYCTPMSKPTCTPHRKALARRFKSGEFKKKDESVDESTVDMKMGPSYKVVQPTLAKTSEPDFFARTNQYDPEVSEGEEQDETFGKGMKTHFSPDWAEEEEEGSMDEVGGQAVQHSSYRTIGHGNLPQSGKQRWADDLDEASKPSKVAKTIQKGMKTKKTKKNPLLKFQPTKKTTSGVHKRKP